MERTFITLLKVPFKEEVTSSSVGKRTENFDTKSHSRRTSVFIPCKHQESVLGLEELLVRIVIGVVVRYLDIVVSTKALPVFQEDCGEVCRAKEAPRRNERSRFRRWL